MSKPPRSQSRGTVGGIIKQNTSSSVDPTSRLKIEKAPANLNPVQPPMKRVNDVNSSLEFNDYANGYSSPGGIESDSTRVSNMMIYKNSSSHTKPYTNRESSGAALHKI